MNLLQQAAIYLGAAIIAVPLFNRLGFGSILGYLIAGIAIGPWVLGLVTDVESIFNVAELGVVLLLFLIGLELQPSRLWVLRSSIFGLGTAQVLVTTAALAAVGWWLLDLDVTVAVVAGLGLSLSSTAFVMQLLAEKKQLTTVSGRAAFSVLLFQDLAVVPMLALIPLLDAGAARETISLSSALAALAAFVILIAVGHYLLRPVFRVVASAGGPEIFTATALLVVIGAAMLTQAVGFSMALGAFLAGVLLADSEYRHELEANIQPFKGLLLGLFFTAVGMSVNLKVIGDQPLVIAAIVCGLLVIKAVVLYLLALLFRIDRHHARNLGVVLAQGGEFAFVLFSVALEHRVLGRDLVDLLIVAVTLSMAATPLLYLFNERVLQRWLEGEAPPVFDTIDEGEAPPVIIAGFGRVGQVVGRILRMSQIPFTALEVSQTQVDFVRKFGGKLYYGDASRVELLRAAHADKAKLFVLAIDDIESSVRTARAVRQHFPNLEIVARVRNRHHAHLLLDLGIKVLVREVYFSSLELTRHVLSRLGFSEEQSRLTVSTFREYDEDALIKQHAIHQDEKMMIQSVKAAARELEALFESDIKSQGVKSQGRRESKEKETSPS
jgi:glutathione-regulated potassium-efflux system ancillary protein KefC/glutathione-regulated potassium-efflux system protein KefB